MVFTVKGCKIKVEFSFFLILSFALITNSEGLVYILLFASLHEIGHIILLYAFKGKADSITVSFYGIGLTHSSKLSKVHEIVFLSGGILINLIFVIMNVHREVNLPLFFLNALPLYPLDGGRIFKILFGINEAAFKVFTYIIFVLLVIYSAITLNIQLILISVYILIVIISEELR